jgi:hypothetical protein
MKQVPKVKYVKWPARPIVFDPSSFLRAIGMLASFKIVCFNLNPSYA